MSPAIEGILNSPFVQITLPLMFTIVIGFVLQSGRFNDLSSRMDRIEKRLDEIEKILRDHGERIARLEERIPPLVHR